ncbi:MFS transporter [Corynebacterium sputi]|uniref:MFS transporter n=1 Tax=Corynebacterium sputi TaxID=489915 RepID=UPI00041B5EDD|nr:MFS transporter [Corynebacterium sputi]
MSGSFGVQFGFDLTQTAVNPLFSALGADGHQLPLLNLAGPITDLLIQPLIGAITDRTWHPRWGRRRPAILLGALLMILTCWHSPSFRCCDSRSSHCGSSMPVTTLQWSRIER